MIKDLSKKIKRLRNENNFSQEYIALKLGMSRPTYIQTEQGKRELTITEAKILAEIFNISFKNFLIGKTLKHKVFIEKKDKATKKSEDFEIRVRKKDLEKFKQVLLYILGKVGGKPNIGETVLHKLLYFIDFDYYEKFEENLMGATYIKNIHGPTSIELKPIIENMQKDGELEVVKSKYFKYEQTKYLPCKRPNLNLFSAQEIEHIDDVLTRLSDKNAKEIENYSHGDIPWKVAEDGKPLSYESVFYRDEYYSVRNYDDEL
ncbi:MAG: DUF4065 domain-containing protein [Patescibacteria group bacterium]|nr:DUF4065 domain-containing protein [Patescibacteria group bacterium]